MAKVPEHKMCRTRFLKKNLARFQGSPAQKSAHFWIMTSKSPSSSSSLHSSLTSPNLRLQSIAGHMSQSSPTSFSAEAVPQAPEDPLFGLMAAYRADTFDKKVDLGIGAYRDDNAKPWVLPVVKKVNN